MELKDLTAKQLKERRAKLVKSMRDLHDGANEEGRSFSGDDDAKWDKMSSDLRGLNREIDLREIEERSEAQEIVQEGVEKATKAKVSPDEARSIYFDAFKNWACKGMQAISQEQRTILMPHMVDGGQEMRALSTAENNTGGMGYGIPEVIQRGIEKFEKFYSDVESYARVINTPKGGKYHVTVSNTTSQEGEIIAENSQHNALDPVIDRVTLDDYTLSSKIVLVSLQSLHDVDSFDLEGFISEAFGERFGRAKETLYTTANGSSTCTGFAYNVTTGQTAAGASALTYDDIVGLIHSVDPAYRRGPNVRLVFNDATFETIKLIKDTNGLPIFVPSREVGLTGDMAGTILGYPYSINQALANVGTTNDSMVFGDFSKFYIRKVNQMGMMRLVERYADYLQVGFLGFQRIDSKRVNDDAIKALTHP